MADRFIMPFFSSLQKDLSANETKGEKYNSGSAGYFPAPPGNARSHLTGNRRIRGLARPVPANPASGPAGDPVPVRPGWSPFRRSGQYPDRKSSEVGIR